MPFDPNYGTLSDDQLLSLGRAAGYLPEEVPEQNYFEFDTPEAAPAPDPNYFEFDTPQAAPQAPESENAYRSPATTSQSYGATQSNRSFQTPKYTEVSRTEGDLNRDYNLANQQAYAGAERVMGLMGATRQGSIDAEKAKAQAVVDKIHGEGQSALVMQRLQDEFSVEEMKANAEAQAQSVQAKADYMAALADFRASKVDPSQLWVNMTGGERFGTLASAFVHDFLGARGINTSAMATFNKAIDRNIDSQVRAIQTKGEVAEGFKSLWYMQRNQSASDAEARSRVRGFLLEGAKQAVIANMAQYEAGLASAQGKAAIAKINEELAKTYVDIYRHADQNAIALRNQALEKWKAKLHAAMEDKALGLRRQELAESKRQFDAKNKPVEFNESLLVPDTTESGGGKARWKITDPDDEVAKRSVKDIQGNLRDFDNNIKRLRELSRKFGAIPTEWGRKMLLTEHQREILQIRDELAYNKVRIRSGASYTKEEIADARASFPIDTWLTRGGTEGQLALAQSMAHEQAAAKMSPWVKEIPEGDPLRNYQLAPVSDSKPGQAEYIEALNTFQPPPLTKEEKSRIAAGKLLRDADKNEVISGEDLTDDVRLAKQDFYSKNPGLKSTATVEDDDAIGGVGEGLNVTRGDKGLVRLRDAVMEGIRDGATEEDKAQARLAYDQLVHYAMPYLNTRTPAEMVGGEYAAEGPFKNPFTGEVDVESMFAAHVINSLPTGISTSLEPTKKKK